MAREISDEEFAEFQRLQNGEATSQMSVAVANFRAENPHIPAKLFESYQGDPEGVKSFGAALLESFPKPSTPPPPAAEIVQPASQPQAVPPPVATAAPAPAATPPIMATQPQPLPTPEQYREQYMRQVAQGGAIQTPEQMAAAARQAAPIPAPGLGEVLASTDARASRSAEIREKMRIGTATSAEAQWLSQDGEKGFVAAATSHGRRVAAIVGARS